MENYDGFLSKSKKIEKTKILPLRWIGNLCGEIAHPHLMDALHYDDHDDHGFAYKYHSIMWLIFSKPYTRWGTFYSLDLDAMKKAWD
jgi:hypothetical protein